MPIRWKGPRNDRSALDNSIGDGGVPIRKKKYPRNAHANRDMRAGYRLTNVDSRFSTVDSSGWGSE